MASSVLLNLAQMVEGVDEALLPAVYAEMAVDLDVGLAALGSLTFVRSSLQALGAPLGAYWATQYNRVHIIGAGAICWAMSIAFVGISESFWQAVIARIFNGIGLAVVTPALMSLVADLTANEERGLAFGWLFAAGQLGTVLGGVFATHMGPHKIMGFAGWRVAFLIVAFVSILLACAIFAFSNDPRGYKRVRDDSDEKEAVTSKSISNVREFLEGAKLVLKVKTFQVIVAQGIVGSVPANAMVFLTLLMELIGFGHSAAALMVALVAVGRIAGAVFGGWFGDTAARWSPDKGRIICSQLSSALGIPIAAILLLVLPKDVEIRWLYGLVMFSAGFLMSWTFPATNAPIFAEIVPEELRTTVYALDTAFEKSLAASGAPLVGILAEHHFGFRRLRGDRAAVAKDLPNARALSKALFACISVPLTMCLSVLSLLYCTYPTDRERARSVRALANEIKELEMGEHWEAEDGDEDRFWDDDDMDFPCHQQHDLTLLKEKEGQD